MKRNINYPPLLGFAWFLSIFLLLIWGDVAVHAQTEEEIRKEIEDRNDKIEELEHEIREYEEGLEAVEEEKETLEGAIETLDISRKKISTDITLTEHKIDSTDLEINTLEKEIEVKENQIEINRQTIAETLRTINEVESDSLIETMLAHDNLSEVWDKLETLERFQLAMQNNIKELSQLKQDLEEKRFQTEDKRTDLSEYKQELAGKKQVLDENRQDKDDLLKITENKEANYQRLLGEKRAAREQFERELQDLESQLKFTLDPSAIPAIGQGVLGWPLDVLKVTQYFGNTPFAQSGAYSGNGHNGIDFRASQGTPVRASLSGVVAGAGNTDGVFGCYSYGKWVLIEHNNGLSTLYAHLSVISISSGQAVRTGDIIGFSGNTGYSTGPHLHFSVYLSEAVEIVRLGDIKKITNCGPARIPVAPLEAYLNPLDYLQRADLLR